MFGIFLLSMINIVVAE